MYCQLDYLGKCLPGRIEHALDELPNALDETYECARDQRHKLGIFPCVVVVSRPRRVEELVESLAFDFNVGQIPKFREDWALEDSLEAVLSTCSTLLSLANVEDSQVVQISHF